MKQRHVGSGSPMQTFRYRATLLRRHTSPYEIRAPLDKLPSPQTSRFDDSVLRPIHDVRTLDSRCHRFSSITSFKYSGISSRGSRRNCIDPSGALEMIVFTFENGSALSG